jgi:phosphoenolpyruvate carboxylase
VLFDALEDAAFKEVNDINGVGTLKHLASEVIQTGSEIKLAEKLKTSVCALFLLHTLPNFIQVQFWVS